MCGLLNFTKGNDIINNKRIFGIVVAEIRIHAYLKYYVEYVLNLRFAFHRPRATTIYVVVCSARFMLCFLVVFYF